ncbi:MAG TPA: hypothetical protein VIV58_25185, partial [Kofleriaceae bacterium]
IKVVGDRPAAELRLEAPILHAVRSADSQLGIRSRIHRASTDANIPLSLGIDALAIGAGGSGGGAHTLPVMAVLYVLLPLPLGLAYFRARFEQEAYAESVRAAAEVWGPQKPRGAEYRNYVIEQFMGPSYGWMWPFRKSLERWYDEVLAGLADER